MDKAGLDELLRRAGRRDPEALAELVEVYSGRVFGLLYRLTGTPDVAEDLLQETFLRVVRTIGRYRHVGKFESWLFRIAANLARDRVRRRERQPTVTSLDASRTESRPATTNRANRTADDPHSLVERQETGQRLATALQRLPEVEREIIVLRHYSQLSFREIAELLRVPLGTALARAHRALGHLRELLADEDR